MLNLVGHRTRRFEAGNSVQGTSGEAEAPLSNSPTTYYDTFQIESPLDNNLTADELLIVAVTGGYARN